MEEAKIVEGKDGKFELENFYTPLEEAKEEIWRRWNDKQLRKVVEEIPEGEIPNFLKVSPRAYLARHLNTPDREFSRFLNLANKINLTPVAPEILADKFFAKNSDKYYLGKLFFYDGKGKNGGNKISTLKIIDYNKSEGQKISDVRTLWGESLVDFHHILLKAAYPQIIGCTPDISKSKLRTHKSLTKFYNNFLLFFVCNSVLFESYLVNEERNLLEESILPSFNMIANKFNKKPLIVRLLPRNTESEQAWYCHPESVKKLLRVCAILK